MDLHSEYPFWLIKEGLINSYPTLEENRVTDVVIIGGGITAALIANKLTELDISVDIIEKRHIAHGSTSASTALLQYEIDVPLFKLSKIVEKDNAIKAYKLCAKAIDEIGEIADRYSDKADFQKQESLFYASFEKHSDEIIKPEFEARKNAGFDLQLLDRNEIKNQFGFDAPSGILSKQAAKINPYKMCNYLFNTIVKKGNSVFDSTEITEISEKENSVFLRTNTGYEIKAKYAIVACGYESQKYLPIEVTDFNSTYAIVSKPMDFKELHWNDNTLIWESKQPYLYMRSTADGRILVGGLDESFSNGEKRDKLIPQKKIGLQHEFKKMFPDINFQIDFAWAGTFGETKDGLPYIGSYIDKRIMYAMGYGGNGITFSLIAANILSDKIRKVKNPNSEIFSFERLKDK